MEGHTKMNVSLWWVFHLLSCPFWALKNIEMDTKLYHVVALLASSHVVKT